jgi:hypothetical protein
VDTLNVLSPNGSAARPRTQDDLNELYENLISGGLLFNMVQALS